MTDLKISKDGKLTISENRRMEDQVLKTMFDPPCPVPCPVPCQGEGEGVEDVCPCPKIKVCDSRWSWLGILILILVVSIVFWWLVLYSVAPSWVRNPNTNTIDTNKVLLAAVVAGFITLLFIGIVYLIIRNSECCPN